MNNLQKQQLKDNICKVFDRIDPGLFLKCYVYLIKTKLTVAQKNDGHLADIVFHV